MSSERRQKIETIFHTATAYTGRERAEYLEKVCLEDAEMLTEIEELLARFDAENTTAEKELDSMQGRVIGAYRLIREIGRGGMGAVYLAERADGMFKTKAAVKLIKRGMDTDSILRRFRNERQILAALNHPNIARLYDAGIASSGQPYLALEYVGPADRRVRQRETATGPRPAAIVPAGGARRRARACPADRASRSEALEHPGHRRWRGEAARLWHRQAAG